MYRLISFYNHNKKAIKKAILIIASFFIVLLIFNSNAKKNKHITIDYNNLENIESNSLITDKSLVTGESVGSSKLNDDMKLIEKFLTYCKEKEIQNAYDCISESCKEQQFSTIDDFSIIYLELFFNNKDIIYNVENWYNNTYKVTIKNNVLSTGKKESYNKQDYISIVNENGENKLNINNYIKKEEFNKQKSINGINIKVLEGHQYMDYMVLNVEIENNSDFTFLLDDLENIKSVYIQDSNDMKYYLYTHEIAKNELLILPKQSKQLSLKFYSKYISTKRITNVVFTNTFFNYGVPDIKQTQLFNIDI